MISAWPKLKHKGHKRFQGSCRSWVPPALVARAGWGNLRHGWLRPVSSRLRKKWTSQYAQQFCNFCKRDMSTGKGTMKASLHSSSHHTVATRSSQGWPHQSSSVPHQAIGVNISKASCIYSEEFRWCKRSRDYQIITGSLRWFIF